MGMGMQEGCRDGKGVQNRGTEYVKSCRGCGSDRRIQGAYRGMKRDMGRTSGKAGEVSG